MTNILVTGGAGYIGSHTVQQLMDAGHNVVVLDDLSTGYKNFVLPQHFVQGSTVDQELVFNTLKQYDIEAVMHFSAYAYVGESVENPKKYYQNNVNGTLQLLAAMEKANVKHFVFSSTCATYGEPDEVPITENCSQNPVNPYGRTKLMVEHMLKDFCAAYGLNFVALRYFNAAGAHPNAHIGEAHDPETHLIPLVLQTALKQRQHITIFGNDYDTPDGTCIRDYIHINDLADAHIKALYYLQNGGKSDAFNLGTEHGYSVQEVIDVCKQVTGLDINVVIGERRPGDPPKLVANAQKAHQILNWQPKYTKLEDIIETAWKWEQVKTKKLAATASV